MLLSRLVAVIAISPYHDKYISRKIGLLLEAEAHLQYVTVAAVWVMAFNTYYKNTMQYALIHIVTIFCCVSVSTCVVIFVSSLMFFTSAC